MSNSAISEPASSSWPRMSPSRLRAKTVLPAPMNAILAMRAGYGVRTATGSLRRHGRASRRRAGDAVAASGSFAWRSWCRHRAAVVVESSPATTATSSTTVAGATSSRTPNPPTPGTPCSRPHASGQSSEKFDFEGVARTYQLYVPGSYRGTTVCPWCSTSTATARTRCNRWSTATSSRSPTATTS